MNAQSHARHWIILLFMVAGLAALLTACSGGGQNSATLTIESEPESGAMVVIGNTNYGETPVTIHGLPAGQYYAILSMYGYRRHTESFVVPEEGEVHLVAEMEPIVGYFTVDSEPVGADVYVDGTNHIGKTPLVNAKLDPGHHTYELRKDNYRTVKGEIFIEEDYSYKRIHELDPMHGWVQVFSRPSGSKIYINDTLQTELTPASFRLAPGTYTIGAYHEGYILKERNVTITPNGETTIDLVLEEGYMPPGMVLVPAGEFIFGVDGGAPDERPQRTIYLDAFYIDKFEVTNREFAEVFPGHVYDSRFADFPVTGVTWSRANEYARAVGKRLPTEKEWEKAARGTDGRQYPWGNTFDPDLCNSRLNDPKAALKVGQFRRGASPYGAMDMAGNVYEWTADWYQPYEGNDDIKVEYGQVYRVLRGGSYQSDQFEVRSPRRHYDKVENARADYGFRCAMDAQLPNEESED